MCRISVCNKFQLPTMFYTGYIHPQKYKDLLYKSQNQSTVSIFLQFIYNEALF